MSALQSVRVLTLAMIVLALQSFTFDSAAHGASRTNEAARLQAGSVCDQITTLESFLGSLRTECGRSGGNLTPGPTPICRAHGMAGSTLESAIRRCSSTYSEISCALNVRCEGGARVCRALGIAGDTIDSAIKRCATQYSEASCSENVACE